MNYMHMWLSPMHDLHLLVSRQCRLCSARYANGLQVFLPCAIPPHLTNLLVFPRPGSHNKRALLLERKEHSQERRDRLREDNPPLDLSASSPSVYHITT